MMPQQPRRSRRALVLIVPIAILLLGVLLESSNLFSMLRYAIRRTADEMPSSRAMRPEDVVQGYPLLSVYASAEHLNDPERGLLTRPLEKGRDWERPAFLSYYDDGQLRFGSEVGLRVHGGKSRVGSPVQSFRIYLRKGYGADHFGQGLLFEGQVDPITRFIAHNDLRKDGQGRWWHLVNPLAYDIARHNGLRAPLTQPVRFFLNGEFLGVYVLMEHLKEPYLVTHFGHTNFAAGDQRTLDRLRRTVRGINPLTIGQVSRLVDIDNLNRWFVTTIFCATTDPFQALMLRDETDPEGRWFWVNWDMDHSFMDLYRRARVPWEHDTFRTVMGQRHPMSDMFTRLLAEDPEYKSAFARLFVDLLNHRMTPAFLDERFEYYRRIAESYGAREREYLPILREFLTRRPAYVRRLMQQYLDAGPSHQVTLSGPPGASVQIDGYQESLPYVGFYPEGTEIRIAIPADRQDRFSHWLVGGRPVETPKPALWHRVGEDTAIEALFKSVGSRQ